MEVNQLEKTFYFDGPVTNFCSFLSSHRDLQLGRQRGLETGLERIAQHHAQLAVRLLEHTHQWQ